jgi:hypothetical protein
MGQVLHGCARTTCGGASGDPGLDEAGRDRIIVLVTNVVGFRYFTAGAVFGAAWRVGPRNCGSLFVSFQ